MEAYFEKNIFIETMVVLPKYLNSNLFTNLKTLLTTKYPKTYLNKGYIFNIKIRQILDNKITLSGQIVVTVEFEADLYTPKIGHIFQGEVKSSSANKFKWVEIKPLTIFLDSESSKVSLENEIVKVQITNIKADNTFCFGKIIS